MSENTTTPIYRMKRTAESSYIHYVSPHDKGRLWFRLFGCNVNDRTINESPSFIKMEKSDLIQDITKEVFQYEMALLKSDVWEQTPNMQHCQILPQKLTQVIEGLTPEDTFLLYVFTEGCGVCKFTSPLVAHLAFKKNVFTPATEGTEAIADVKVLSIYGYEKVLALTNEAWIMESPGVPKFFLFEGSQEPRLLHNPDLLGDYNPDETYRRLEALFVKEV